MTTDGDSNISKIQVRCYLYTSADGYSNSIKSAVSSRTTPGQVNVYNTVPTASHRGRTLRNNCTHTVWYKTGGIWQVTSTSQKYIP